jgi:predicted DNA-binding transcriptional regulator AlpA
MTDKLTEREMSQLLRPQVDAEPNHAGLNAMTNDLLNEQEAAPLLRLKIKTLQTWRTLKKGPRFVRVGRLVFYPRSELEQFLTNSLVETARPGRDAR